MAASALSQPGVCRQHPSGWKGAFQVSLTARWSPASLLRWLRRRRTGSQAKRFVVGAASPVGCTSGIGGGPTATPTVRRPVGGSRSASTAESSATCRSGSAWSDLRPCPSCFCSLPSSPVRPSSGSTASPCSCSTSSASSDSSSCASRARGTTPAVAGPDPFGSDSGRSGCVPRQGRLDQEASAQQATSATMIDNEVACHDLDHRPRHDRSALAAAAAPAAPPRAGGRPTPGPRPGLGTSPAAPRSSRLGRPPTSGPGGHWSFHPRDRFIGLARDCDLNRRVSRH